MLLSVLVFGLASCDNDDDAAKVKKPVVELTEMGAGNSGEVTAGSDLHLEAGWPRPGPRASMWVCATPTSTSMWTYRPTCPRAATGLC